VRNAVLVLEGQVPTARDREDAENAAARVPGLTEIVNQIRLVSVPVDPEQIRRRLEHILSNKVIFGRVADLKVDVRQDGTVVLFGTAPTLSEKRTAERVAFGIQGVAAVENQILIRHYVRP
jgi:osmotically-inducible protein OsmY